MRRADVCLALGITEQQYEAAAAQVDAMRVEREDGTILVGEEFLGAVGEVLLDEILESLDDGECFGA